MEYLAQISTKVSIEQDKYHKLLLRYSVCRLFSNSSMPNITGATNYPAVS